ncbi:MAG: serine hydrolase [Flavobacteriales bacterium]|nr:serine hydrolase [Flavobacteriales bacterium]
MNNKKAAKRKNILLVFLLLGAIVIGHLITGYGYLFRGVYLSYFQGQSGPGINDAHLFYNNEIASPNSIKFVSSSKKNNIKLPEKELALLEKINTASFIVVKNDSLIFEKYWGEYTSSTATNSFSAAKSLVSLLIGIAIEEGKIDSVDQPVAAFLEEFNTDGKSKITIRNLLTMSSGLSWKESGKNPYSDNAKGYYGQHLREHIKSLKVIQDPGKIFNYKSGDTQILVYVLERATDKTISDYMQEKIWSKINAESIALWNLDRENGDEKGFCCFYATAKDYAKIGQLILNNGKWGSDQIIPIYYLQNALLPAQDILEKDGSINKRYGWQWWYATYNNQPIHYARGLLGQYIIVYPAKKLVIVRTGEKRKKVQKDGHPADLWDYLRLAELVSK